MATSVSESAKHLCNGHVEENQSPSPVAVQLNYQHEIHFKVTACATTTDRFTTYKGDLITVTTVK